MLKARSGHETLSIDSYDSRLVLVVGNDDSLSCALPHSFLIVGNDSFSRSRTYFVFWSLEMMIVFSVSPLRPLVVVGSDDSISYLPT